MSWIPPGVSVSDRVGVGERKVQLATLTKHTINTKHTIRQGSMLPDGHSSQ